MADAARSETRRVDVRPSHISPRNVTQHFSILSLNILLRETLVLSANGLSVAVTQAYASRNKGTSQPRSSYTGCQRAHGGATQQLSSDTCLGETRKPFVGLLSVVVTLLSPTVDLAWDIIRQS